MRRAGNERPSCTRFRSGACPAQRGDRLARERVRALVLGMAGMALDPVPDDLVRRHRIGQALPEVDILDGLLRRRLPAVAPPAVDPPGDAVAQIVRIGVRSEEHTSALQSLMRISYAVFCLNKTK